MLKRNRKAGGQLAPPAAPMPAPVAASTPAQPASRRSLHVCLGLAAVVLTLYARTLGHEFVKFDDDLYAYNNPHLTGGLTAENAVWAFTHVYAENWHPLTWLSHMLDWDLYGDKAGGHHLTSAVIHAANSVLLFLALRALSGSLWPSAAVAALWAVHPLRVESVAWVSERKDVLCGLFFLLTLLAYASYTRAPTVWRYALVAALFALGLMAKPMLVTLPAVLLLLDYWPLGRLGSRAGVRRCVLEKLPLLALSFASAVITVHAQQKAVRTLEEYSLGVRIANAADAYLTYAVQTVVPIDLAVIYPHPGASLPAWRVVAAAVFLIGATAGAILARTRRPYLLVGWLWYLGMLVPVIGLVQVGGQAHADRYTYLPQIGLLVALAWAVADLPRRTEAVGVVVAVLAALCWQQVGYWRDTATLFSHALDSTTNNAVAHGAYGHALLQQGEPEEAVKHLRRAIEINDDPQSRVTLGAILVQRGQLDEAADQFRHVLERAPTNALARRNLALVHVLRGITLERSNRLAEAVGQFEGALEIDPELPDGPGIRQQLGKLYLGLAGEAERKGQTADALGLVRKALARDPASAEARKKLAELERTPAP